MAVKIDLVYPAGLLIVRVHSVRHVFSFHWIIDEMLVVGLARVIRAFAATRYFCHMGSPLCG